MDKETIEKTAKRAFEFMIMAMTWLEDDELGVMVGFRVKDNIRRSLDNEGKALFDAVYIAAESEG